MRVFFKYTYFTVHKSLSKGIIPTNRQCCYTMLWFSNLAKKEHLMTVSDPLYVCIIMSMNAT